jgi:hypothetical protein
MILPKLPKSRTIASREEYMEIMGGLELASKRGEDMNTFLNREYGITPIEYARAGMQWMATNSLALKKGKDSVLQKVLDKDMDTRHEVYRKKYLPTYEAFMELTEKIAGAVGHYYNTYECTDATCDSVTRNYSQQDATEKIKEEVLKEYNLDLTIYEYAVKYWNNWLEQEKIKKLHKIFKTVDSFKDMLLTVTNKFEIPLMKIFTEDEETLTDKEHEILLRKEGIIIEERMIFLTSHGLDIEFWLWASSYGKEKYYLLKIVRK